MGKNQKEASFGQGLGLGMTLQKAMAAAVKKYDVGFDEVQKLIENDSTIYDGVDKLIRSTRPYQRINKRRLFVRPTDGSGDLAKHYFLSERSPQILDYVISETSLKRTPAIEIEIINANRDARLFEHYPDLVANAHKIAFTIDQVAMIWEDCLLKGYLDSFDRAIFLIHWHGSYGYLELADIKMALPHVELLTGSEFSDSSRVAIIPKLTPNGKRVIKICKEGQRINGQPDYSRMVEHGIKWISIDESFNQSECKITDTFYADTYDLVENVYSWTEIFYDICPEFNKIALTINEVRALNRAAAISDNTTAYLIEQDNRFFVVELKKRMKACTGKIYKLTEGGALNVNGKHKIVTRNVLPMDDNLLNSQKNRT